MNNQAQFAYLQVRLQARHGQRPGDQVWRQLDGAGDMANYLHTIRRTSLRHWVPGSDGSHDSHELEISLRRQFRNYVDEVSGWVPEELRDSVRWIKRLPDLPALLHLLRDRTAPGWLLKDPALKTLASGYSDQRQEAFSNSDCSAIAEAWHAGTPLTQAWLERWLRSMPVKTARQPGIIQCGKLLHEHISRSDQVATEQRRTRLEQQLVSMFRRSSFQITAAYAHLGLIALDLERIRSGLARRACFPNTSRAAS